MLPIVLRRWSLCYSYFMWLCGIYYWELHAEFCLALCSRVFAASVCFLCICLFILHTLISVFFSSKWRQGFAAAGDCGTRWTFL